MKDLIELIKSPGTRKLIEGISFVTTLATLVLSGTTLLYCHLHEKGDPTSQYVKRYKETVGNQDQTPLQEGVMLELQKEPSVAEYRARARHRDTIKGSFIKYIALPGVTIMYLIAYPALFRRAEAQDEERRLNQNRPGIEQVMEGGE